MAGKYSPTAPSKRQNTQNADCWVDGDAESRNRIEEEARRRVSRAEWDMRAVREANESEDKRVEAMNEEKMIPKGREEDEEEDWGWVREGSDSRAGAQKNTKRYMDPSKRVVVSARARILGEMRADKGDLEEEPVVFLLPPVFDGVEGVGVA